MRNLCANLGVVFASCLVGLFLCEVSLRLFYPKYRELADAQFFHDAQRIWARTPHQRSYRHHPDAGSPHPFYHNNLALRQHRNFSTADLASATNVGVFGDSFVENIYLPAPYSFTEPLDFLLNQSGKRFNVLNFGVQAYGPGQSFLHYEYFRYADNLDHVFYVYCDNDLWDLYATKLFSLDEAGRLIRNETIRASWWGPLIRRLHTPYLLLDVSGRWPSLFWDTTLIKEHLQDRHDERLWDGTYGAIKRAFRQRRPDDAPLKNSLAIFRQLIRRWKHLAEHNGSSFSVVLLPNHPPQPFVVDLLRAEDVEVIDLYDCFGDIDPAHLRQRWEVSPYRSKNGPHWNEVGNRLAAVCLYRRLEEKMSLPRLPEDGLQKAIFQYYAAFGSKGRGGGRRIDLSGDVSRDSGEIPGT